MTLLRTKEGVDFRFFRGNNQFTGTGVILLYNAVDLRARVELRAKIRDGRVADLDRQHPAGNTGTDSMKILTGSKKAALAATGLTAGRLCTVSGTLHLGDDYIDAGPHHISKHEVGSLLSQFPHFGLADQNGDAIRHHNGTEFPLIFKHSCLAARKVSCVEIHTDDRSGNGAAAAERGIDGVPFFPFLFAQPPIQFIEVQLVEERALALFIRRIKRFGVICCQVFILRRFCSGFFRDRLFKAPIRSIGLRTMRRRCGQI